MNLLRTAFLCTAIVGLAGLSVVHAEDKPVPSNGAVTPEQPPVHCEGQNCLPPAEDHVEECKGQACTPAPATNQTPAPEIEQVK
ncbi:hypothetical protein [Mesorhizobium neociceri]|uniref:Secreted protein n=1 Tax=Mesorhizobium neociceri TaxID=1307853 RepID=A0A838BFQ2_9HYPH|nr:hypothetical protein [Mesorhizobium neociceri]MBA1144290.1 hypothetical protein [Mesorhizobium neociceri]